MHKVKNTYNADWLLNPIDKNDFVKNYWQKQHLLIQRQSADYFCDVLSFDDIDHILASSDLRYPDVRLANSKEAIDYTSYVNDEGLIKTANLLSSFSKGSTIILNQLQRRSENLRQLCSTMEKEFSFPFQTNIYCTPGGYSQGFNAHYDTHDVFVMQIHGSKNWKLYDRPVINPMVDQDFLDHPYEKTTPTYEFTLEPGDLLYIPRGLVHDASSTNDCSIHITFGAMAYTWKHLFDKLLEVATETDENFRNALPIDLLANPDSFIKQFSENYKSFFSENIFKKGCERLNSEFIESRPPAIKGHFKALCSQGSLKKHQKFKVRQDAFFTAEEKNGFIHLKMHGKTVSFPGNFKSSFNKIISSEVFSIDELSGGLTDIQKRNLVKELIVIGLLHLENAESQIIV